MLLQDVPRFGGTGTVWVMIETPRGSRAKFKYDSRLDALTLHKLLPMGLVFPFAFGFVPNTRGEDADPVDVLVLLDVDLPAGVLVETHLCGVLKAEQTAAGRTYRNDRFLAVPALAHQDRAVADLKDIPSRELDELDTFFATYNAADGKQYRPVGRGGREEALSLLASTLS